LQLQMEIPKHFYPEAQNRTIREEVARVVIDSFKQIGQTDNFDLVLNQKSNLFNDDAPSVRSDKSLASVLVLWSF